MQLDLNQLQELLAAINQTDISELILKADDFELSVRRGQQASVASVQPVVPVGDQLVAAALPTLPQLSDPPQVSSAPASPPTPPTTKKENWVEITSPMVGTFYRAPAPNEPSFVNVGDRIRTGQTVCIIEAMKLMNELESEVSGEVLEILVENGQPVEFNQPLLRVVPD